MKYFVYVVETLLQNYFVCEILIKVILHSTVPATAGTVAILVIWFLINWPVNKNHRPN